MRLFRAVLVSAVAASHALAQNGLTLPVGQNLHPRPEQAADVVLDVDAAGSYALNGRPLAPAHLAEQLEPLMQRSRDRVLYVRADARLPASAIDAATAIAARGSVCVVSLIATQRAGTLSRLKADAAAYDAAARRAIDVQLPIARAPYTTIARQQMTAIVIEALPGPAYRINTKPVTPDSLARRLHEIFDPRPVKLVYVRADPTVAYQDVFHAIDIAREAGVQDIVAAPPELAIRKGLPAIDLTLRVTPGDDLAAERIAGNVGRCRRGDVYFGQPVSGAGGSRDAGSPP